MKSRGFQPSRRRLLRAVVTAAVLAPVALPLGRVLERAARRRRPTDLPPIPWLGHC